MDRFVMFVTYNRRFRVSKYEGIADITLLTNIIILKNAR